MGDRGGKRGPFQGNKISVSVPEAGPRAAAGARDSPSRVLIVGVVFEEF